MEAFGSGIFESETCYLSSRQASQLVNFDPTVSAVQMCIVSPPVYLPPGHHVGIWTIGSRSVLAIPYEKTLGIMDDENLREGHWSSIPGQEVIPGRGISLKRHFKRRGCWRAYLEAVQSVSQHSRRSSEKKRSYEQYVSSGKRVDACEPPPPIPIVERLTYEDDVERERRSVEIKWGPKMAPELQCD